MDKQSRSICVKWEARAKFWVEDGSGGLVSLADWQSSLRRLKMLPETSRCIHVKGDILRFRGSREGDLYIATPLDAKGKTCLAEQFTGINPLRLTCLKVKLA